MQESVWLEPYWRQFIDIKIAEEYYLQYIHSSKRWIVFLNVFCFLTSCAAVISWITSYLDPLLSSLIVLISQIVSALQPFYPFAERLYAARCIHREIRGYSLAAEQTLNRALFGAMEEDELSTALEKLQINISSTEDKYANADMFPRNKRFHKIAQKSVETYIKIHFNIDAGGSSNEGQPDPAANTVQHH